MPQELATGVHRPRFGALMTFPAACFIVTVITDIAYARSANMAWETFSIWLLTIGLITGGFFVVVGLVQAFAQGLWPSMTLRIGYAIALIIALFNAFVHSRDGYTSVVPTGLTLSILTVLVLVATWWVDLRGLPDRAPATTRYTGER